MRSPTSQPTDHHNHISVTPTRQPWCRGGLPKDGGLMVKGERDKNEPRGKRWASPNSAQPTSSHSPRSQGVHRPSAAPSVRLAAGNEPHGCGESQRWHRDVPSRMITEASRSARDQAAAGIRPGVKGAWPYAPLPPPSAGGGQITAPCKAEPDHSGSESTSNPLTIY